MRCIAQATANNCCLYFLVQYFMVPAFTYSRALLASHTCAVAKKWANNTIYLYYHV